MTETILDCMNHRHSTLPHHHSTQDNGWMTCPRPEHCSACRYGAPKYRRAQNPADLVREAIEAGCTWKNDDPHSDRLTLGKVKAAISRLPDDWADHVAIVRKLTCDELLALDKVPAGFAVAWSDGDGDLCVGLDGPHE